VYILDFDYLLKSRGITRRAFLQWCGATAAFLGLSQTYAGKVAEVIAQAATKKRPAVIWSVFQECLGCTESLAQNRQPGVASLVLDILSLDYSETLGAAPGIPTNPKGKQGANTNFDDTVTAGGFVYVCEGAVAMGIPNAMTIGGRTSKEIVKETATKALMTINIGNCSSFGNVQAADPNPTGAKGVPDALKEMLSAD